MRRNTTPAARRRSRTQSQFTAMAATASLAADLQMLRSLQDMQTESMQIAVTV